MLRKCLIASICLLWSFSSASLPRLPWLEAKSYESIIDYTNIKLNIIKYINGLNTTWKAGINNRFYGKPRHVVQKMMGCVKKVPGVELDVLSLKHLLGNEGIPKHFDSRQEWPQCGSVAEIRDQSNCGSCWAFGATEAMTDRICIFSNGTQQPHISADDLLSCCSECGNGCFGGDPASAWQFFVRRGLVTGGNYTTHDGCRPYPFPPCDHHINGTLKPCPHKLEPTPKCLEKCQTGYPKPYKQDKFYGSKAYAVENDAKTIQKEIMMNGPVEAAFEVYEDFELYKSGVYQHKTGQSMGGHAVRMIGWGEDEHGTPYWLIANSWNVEWGERGLFRIKRGSNECGIEEDITAGHPKMNRVRDFYARKWQ